MTNKLPVVGKRYKRQDQEYKCVGLNLYGKDFYFKMLRDKADLSKEYNLCDFYQFEEIPNFETTATKESVNSKKEDQVQIKPETQSHISELSPEVKEAMEELRRFLKCWDYCGQFPAPGSDEYNVFNSSKILINALDNQFKEGKIYHEFEYKPFEIQETEKILADEIIKRCGNNEQGKVRPDENGSFKHIDNAEEMSQDLMKEASKKQVESEEELKKQIENNFAKNGIKVRWKTDTTKVNETNTSVDFKEEEVNKVEKGESQSKLVYWIDYYTKFREFSGLGDDIIKDDNRETSHMNAREGIIKKLANLSQNLVNALEAKKSQPEVTFQIPVDSSRGFNSETWRDVTDKDVVSGRAEYTASDFMEHVGRCEDALKKMPKPKIDLEYRASIWKDVSELPKVLDNYLIKDGNRILLINDIRALLNAFNGKGLKIDGEEFCTLTDFINDYEKLKERVKKLEGK